MVQLFFGNRSFALLFLPVLAAVYIALNVYFPYFQPEESAHFGFWGNFLSQSNWISQFLAPLLVLAEAVLINSLFNRNEFMERNTYTPALLYVTCMSVFHCFYFLDGFAIAQFSVVMAVHQLFRLYQNEDGRRHVFNVGFWLGIACTFHPVLCSFGVDRILARMGHSSIRNARICSPCYWFYSATYVWWFLQCMDRYYDSKRTIQQHCHRAEQ